MRRSLRTRARRHLLLDITLTPIIDVALTLLVIFIMAAPALHNAIKVTLPKGSAQEDTALNQEMVVHIDKEKQLFFNNKPVTYPDLLASIKERAAKAQQKTVYIKADRTVAYGDVIELVDDIKRIEGIASIALPTMRRVKQG